MKGFVFGKYLPFHNGHKALIDFALSKCEFLYVVICASNQENIDVELRATWIKQTYLNIPNIKIIQVEYNEEILPSTSKTSIDASRAWSEKFLEVLPQIDLIITSEEYGKYVADFMDIVHLPFDKQRNNVPISATQIRNSLYQNWNFLPDAVKKTYQKKIVFSGTECTGKSSISKSLSTYYKNSSLVEEVAREIITNSALFTQVQLYEVAHKHSQNIQKATALLKPFVFIDTDVYTTQSYSKYFFKEYLDLESKIYTINKADYVFYLTKGLNYRQDGTRLNQNQRNKLDVSHRKILRHFGIEYTEIEGDWGTRFDKVVKEIEKCLLKI